MNFLTLSLLLSSLLYSQISNELRFSTLFSFNLPIFIPSPTLVSNSTESTPTKQFRTFGHGKNCMLFISQHIFTVRLRCLHVQITGEGWVSISIRREKGEGGRLGDSDSGADTVELTHSCIGNAWTEVTNHGSSKETTLLTTLFECLDYLSVRGKSKTTSGRKIP